MCLYVLGVCTPIFYSSIFPHSELVLSTKNKWGNRWITSTTHLQLITKELSHRAPKVEVRLFEIRITNCAKQICWIYHLFSNSFRTVTASPTVSWQLSTDGWFASLQQFSYLYLFVSCLLQGINLVSFFSGEVCVVHLCNFDWPVKGHRCYRISPTWPALLKIALHPWNRLWSKNE